MFLRTRPRTVTLFDFLAPAFTHSRPASTQILHTGIKKQRRETALHLNDETVKLLQSIKTHIPATTILAGAGATKAEVKVVNSTMGDIHDLIANRQPDRAYKLWKFLKAENLIRLLTPAHMSNLSKVMEVACLKPFQRTETSTLRWFSPEDRKALSEFAILAAERGAEEGLSAHMATMVRDGRMKEVLELFERYLPILKRSEGPEKDTKSDGDVLFPDFSQLSDSAVNPHRSRILLSAMAVYAHYKDFRSALHACLNNTIRFTSTSIRQFSHVFLNQDAELQQEFGSFVSRLSYARMVAKASTFPSRIMALAAQNRYGLLEAMYKVLRDGLLGPEPYIAPAEKDISTMKPIAMSDAAWCAFISSFVKGRRFEFAAGVWDDLLRVQPQAPVGAWTALIDGYASVDAYPETLATWDAMLKQGVHPEPLTYRALIHAMLSAKQFTRAFQLFEEFRKKFPLNPKNNDPLLVVHNTVINSLLLAGQEHEDQARSIMDTMQEKGPKPDSTTYNMWMRYYGKRSNFTALAELVKEMGTIGMSGDVYTFSTILSSLLRAGRQNAANLVVTLMRKQGVPPNVATFSALIDYQMREQTEQGLQSALHLLRMMEQDADPDAQPNAVTYTTILSGVHRGGWLPIGRIEDTRDMIIARMRERRIPFNPVIYQILITACLDDLSPKGLQEAMDYYREMRRKKIVIPLDNWYMILRGLVHRAEWEAAHDVLEDMLRDAGSRDIPSRLISIVSTIRNERRRRPT